MFAVGLGLLLGTEGPMTPNGVDLSLLFFSLLWPLVEVILGGIEALLGRLHATGLWSVCTGLRSVSRQL